MYNDTAISIIGAINNEEATMENKFKAGQEVWIHFPWVDAHCWYKGTYIKETAKRYKVNTDIRGDIYVLKSHVEAA